MPDFATLTRIDLRAGWPGEARDFTPWLADNLTQLGDALGIDLELVAQEVPVGSFSLDLLARDVGRDRLVVIENQLEATNHDHLGKLLTYAAGHDASVAVWVTANFREEHRQALDWLNQRTDENTEFFGVVVELIRIGDSPFAVNFRPVAFPNSWGKETKAASASGSMSNKKLAYQAYFQTLLDELRSKYNFTRVRSASPRENCGFGTGYSGIELIAWFVGDDRLRAEVYLNRSEPENKAIYDLLHARKDEIESAFGAKLTWERLDNRKASRIAIYRAGSITDSDEELDELRGWLIDQLLRLRETFVPRLNQVLKSERAPVIETKPSGE